jgi:diphthine-ammonia ligase
MDVVGLVSGGKDSIYNLIECVRRGHHVVALANLYPAPTGGAALASRVERADSSAALSAALVPAAAAHVGATEAAPPAQEEELPQELDSYMFQTVGHTAIAAMAEAMALPLVRRQTAGRALHNGLQYPAAGAAGAEPPGSDRGAPGDGAGPAARDEVEDLYDLLADVKRAHPSVAGVSCGAILSTYQRLRVEAVCARVGLLCHAFLWQREQAGLLQDMIDARVDAVLVKVAAAGLSTRMLGRGIAALQPALLKAVRGLGPRATV